LYEADAEIGGQFNLAKRIPGKEEFHETLRYYRRQIERLGIRLNLNHRVTPESWSGQEFDEVFLATGVRPRSVQLEGITHPKVLSYLQVLKDFRPVGQRVAIVGAGGIGFDVASFLSQPQELDSPIPAFMREWGVDMSLQNRGALVRPAESEPVRAITLCQRSKNKPGERLGKTTGWIHRSVLRRRGVEMLVDVQYVRIDDLGLHLLVGGQPRVLDVDHVIICAGQESLRELENPLKNLGIPVRCLGGAFEARELDAKRAIEQATWMAAEV
jgi:2,4-dienoyl-CoA reductase (NADPH2)